jgi:hypothetical protein
MCADTRIMARQSQKRSRRNKKWGRASELTDVCHTDTGDDSNSEVGGKSAPDGDYVTMNFRLLTTVSLSVLMAYSPLSGFDGPKSWFVDVVNPCVPSR